MARYHALSDQIKAAEKRMAEIAVLRTHIAGYAKTRDTYVAYRKAGYSKKFRQEHEEEILLHQVAKEAFNELNVKKLPTIKELQTEHAQLLADKKKAYGEYRQARAAMRELLTVKNNVDRVLAVEQTELTGETFPQQARGAIWIATGIACQSPIIIDHYAFPSIISFRHCKKRFAALENI